MRVHLITFGCKANQYDSAQFQRALEARGARAVDDPALADVCVLNTCTVTNQADADARKAIRKLRRAHPDLRLVIAGCSAALRGDDYLAMPEVESVLGGHDAQALANLIAPLAPHDDHHEEPIGAAAYEARGTRAWLKIQDGCDRRCAFCATRLARGASRSRDADALIAEARALAIDHPEIVLTGVHIGHYGVDLSDASSLSRLVARLLDEVPQARFRLGSVEATELDDLMLTLLQESGGRLTPHLHIPMQSGADPVLRRMRRWHTRAQYQRRVEQLAERLPYLGLGADVIVGFPGETDEDHAQTRALIETLPFTYLHVFPYSVRDDTPAATMPEQVHGALSATRARELRELAIAKGLAYRRQRVGQGAEIVVEQGGYGVTEDYLRVRLAARDDDDATPPARAALIYAPLRLDADGEGLMVRV